MKHANKSFIFILVLLLTLSGCSVTSVRQHPEFANGKRKIQVIAVLPPDVEYRHLVFTGENERDPKIENEIAKALETDISSALESHGYSTKADILKKISEGDKQFNFAYEQLKGAYMQAAKELYAQQMVQVTESDKFKVGIGPIANPFAAACNADALFFARYSGFDKSTGLITKDIVASALLGALTGSYYVPASNGGRIDLALIDGVTGDVLWTNNAGGPTTHYTSLMAAIEKLPNRSVLAGEELKIAQDVQAKKTIATTE